MELFPTHGLFLSFGGGVGWKPKTVTGEPDMSLGASASVAIRNEWPKIGEQGVMFFLAGGLQYGKTHMVADFSHIYETNKPGMERNSWRLIANTLLAEGKKTEEEIVAGVKTMVEKKDWAWLGYMAAMQTFAPKGSTVTPDDIILVNDGSTAVIGPPTIPTPEPSLPPAADQGSPERRRGTAVVTGVRLEKQMTDTSFLLFTAEAGLMEDSKYGAMGVGHLRLEYRFDFSPGWTKSKL